MCCIPCRSPTRCWSNSHALSFKVRRRRGGHTGPLAWKEETAVASASAAEATTAHRWPTGCWRSRNDTKIPNLFPVGDDDGAARQEPNSSILLVLLWRTRAWRLARRKVRKSHATTTTIWRWMESREKKGAARRCGNIKPIQGLLRLLARFSRENEARQLSPEQINLSPAKWPKSSAKKMRV